MGLELNVDGYIYKKFEEHFYSVKGTITETSGVDAHLTEIQKCYKSSNACETGSVDIRIKGGGKSEVDLEFLSKIAGDTVNIKYLGTDANGYDIDLEIPLTLITESINGNGGGDY